jgi:hypothetical protein
VWIIFHSFRVEKYPISGMLQTENFLSICYHYINNFFHLKGISFATVQIKEHFYCTRPKRCAINNFTRMRNRVLMHPTKMISKMPDDTKTGLRDKVPYP